MNKNTTKAKALAAELAMKSTKWDLMSLGNLLLLKLDLLPLTEVIYHF